jgi:DNA modification methylase
MPFSEAHFATFPTKLVEPCILAGCPEGGLVLDPFNGSGTTGLVATRLQRRYIGIELNPEYVAMSRRRITDDAPLFNSTANVTENHETEKESADRHAGSGEVVAGEISNGYLGIRSDDGCRPGNGAVRASAI